jgi:hypothetical protein
MKFKIITLLTIALIASDIRLSAQSYYNPRNEINITLTIKEPYKPVNYAEIGKNFNDMLQAETARREALKRYYDQIYFETKSSISTNTFLTDDNALNQKILLLQNITLENLDSQNKSLKMGMIKPENYESELRNIYYNYMNSNQVFLNLSRYKYLKLIEYKTDSLKNIFIKDFNTALTSIIKFDVEANSTEFTMVGLAESISAKENKSINQLYNFITNICEGKLALYQSNWQQKKLIEQQNALNIKNFNDQWIKMAIQIVNSRSDKLKTLDQKRKLKYLKSERQYLNEKLGEQFINWHFGKGSKFVDGIDVNINVIIYRFVKEDEKVSLNSRANLFYKSLDEFCNCGSYNPSIFN